MIIGPTEFRPVNAAKSAGSLLPAVLAGKVIEARLLMALGDGVFRFTSAENEFDLPLPKNLAPGTQVRIEAQPGGGLRLTIVEEGAPGGVPQRPVQHGQQPVSLPPLNVTVHPRTPLPTLPPGQPVEARVVSNPREGTVRVALPQGEVDLPLPRALPAGTAVRITPQPGGAVQVNVPGQPSAPAFSPAPPAASGHAAANAASHASPVAARPAPAIHPFIFTVRPAAPPPGVAAGQVVEAHFVSAPQAGVARIAVAGQEFDLPLPQNFPPGTQARIAAQPNGELVVTVRADSPVRPAAMSSAEVAGRPAAPPVAAGAPPVQTAAHTPQPVTPQPVTLQPGPGMPVLPPNQIVEAKIAALPQPTGMVRLTSPIGDFELPLPQNLPPGTPVRIVPQPSGALTVVPLGTGAEGTAKAAAPQGALPPVTLPPVEIARAAARGALTKQDGLAPLFADIEELPYRLNAPVPVRRAAEKLLNQRLPLDFVANPEQLAKAIAASGLFAERTLSSLPPTQAAPPDLKLALFVLRAALGDWGPVRTDTPPPRGTPMAPPGAGMPPAAQAPSENAQQRGLAQAGAMTEAPEHIVPRLASETDAALARLSLHQIASLPDERMAARADQPDMRWSCEIPVNVDGRTAMFGFVIERDGRHAQHEREKKKWRVRAAIDLAETGAVEADVRLKCDVVTAGLVAEQPETARMLDAALPMLRDGLTAAGFEVDTLSVRLGKAQPDAGPRGHFVDRST